MNSKNRHLKISFIGRVGLSVIAGLVLFQLGGCTTRQEFTRDELNVEEKQKIEDELPSELHQYYFDLQEEGERNAVLNYMRLGKAAYALGYQDIAHRSFVRATAGIEQVYGYDEAAADARSLWMEEGSKIFKGEPYERAMAFFYQGVTFIDQVDYENARASFMSGQLQDAFAEDDQNRTDFALLLYLDGWCSLAMKDTELANQRFDEVHKRRPKVELPQIDDNLLILVETGKSPRKVADGLGHSELKFRRGRNFSDKSVEISFDGESFVPAIAIEDIYYQAATRGGREVDKIVQGKAQFRTATTKGGNVLSDIGSTAVVISPLLSTSASVGLAGGAIGLVGVTSMAIGQSSRPHADTRYWDSLPDGYHVLSTKLNPGKHTVTINFVDEQGTFLSKTSKEVTIPSDELSKQMIWFASEYQI